VVSELLRFDRDRVSIQEYRGLFGEDCVSSLKQRWTVYGIVCRSQNSIGSVRWDHFG